MDDSIKNKIDSMVKDNKVFLFMKGTPAQPMCGFSAGVVKVLSSMNISFNSFNVLSDDSIRQGIKDYANWPTIPQLYVNGEFIGGHDIVVQMSQSGDLAKLVSN